MSTSSSSTRNRVVRLAALVATPALALGGLAAVPAPSYAAVDPSPATAGATWLAGELTDGALVGDFGPDYGLTIDAGLALVAVDAQPAAVAAITNTLAANIDDYVTGEAFDDRGSLYAGPAAKAATFATEAGQDPSAFGGRDLIADVESAASDSPAIQGRLADTSSFGDFANTIGQSFAVRALDAADSPEAGAVTDFLLAQQCSEGFFRLSFAAPTAADQTCDGDPASAASTDVTGLALTALLSRTGDPEVAAAITAATDWLVSTQAGDGSWGGDAPTTAPNANSTGLAGAALRAVRNDPEAAAAARDAAAWIRAHQADEIAPCATSLITERGAVAYDDASLRAGRSDGITAPTRDQFRRATAQALPALLAAQTGSTADRSSRSFVRAGSVEQIRVRDLAPGQTLCVSGRGVQDLVNADVDGVAVTSVQVPDRQSVRGYDLTVRGADLGTVVLRALAKKTFGVSVKAKRLPVDEKQRVTVTGFAKGESLTVRYQGRVIERLVGAGKRVSTTFDVVRTPGVQRVQVFGEFGTRKGTEKFRVVKAR